MLLYNILRNRMENSFGFQKVKWSLSIDRTVIRITWRARGMETTMIYYFYQRLEKSGVDYLNPNDLPLVRADTHGKTVIFFLTEHTHAPSIPFPVFSDKWYIFSVGHDITFYIYLLICDINNTYFRISYQLKALYLYYVI